MNPLLITLGFAIFQFLTHKRDSQNEIFIKLERIDRQVNLFGSLFGKLMCSRHIFIEFARLEGYAYPEDFMSLVDAIESKPESSISKRYRSLMSDVLGPIQLEILELIEKNESLFNSDESEGMLDLLLDYMLMASSYKVIFARWRLGDYSIHFSHRRFPPELIETLRHELMYSSVFT
jgi:hypothetical protein